MDTQRCPLCGRSNQCSVAAEHASEPCWCFDTPIDPAALERLTPEQRNQACLCPACAGVLDAAERSKQN